jgi:dolichyldiphosphatase
MCLGTPVPSLQRTVRAIDRLFQEAATGIQNCTDGSFSTRTYIRTRNKSTMSLLGTVHCHIPKLYTHKQAVLLSESRFGPEPASASSSCFRFCRSNFTKPRPSPLWVLADQPWVPQAMSFNSIDTPDPDECDTDTPPSLSQKVQFRINKLTKWVVSASVFFTLLARRCDAITQWYIIGGVVTAIVCRFLKFAINASRPVASYRKDPGMPSSHASALGFLSVFPFLMSSSSTLSWLLPIGGSFLAWLRVSQGYHTYPQVVVGWVLGTFMAVAWKAAGQVTLPVLTSSALGRACLGGACLFFMGFFALKNVLIRPK